MKRILKYISIFISYFIYSFVFKAILYSFNINYYNFEPKYKILFTFITELIYIFILIFIYKKDLKEEIINFKENYKTYIPKNILIYLLGILLMGSINLILTKITNNISSNETIIRDYISKYPLYMAFSAIIYAPLVEELIFRKTIRKIFKNKYLFIIISGIIFGLLHVTDITNPIEYLYAIPYIIMGIDFAYIYYRTDNIFTTITFHLCHNLVLLIIQLL